MAKSRRNPLPLVPRLKPLERGETVELKIFGRRRAEVDADALKAALAGPVESLLSNPRRIWAS